MNKRKKHSNEFKTKVVLEALKERLTLSELVGKYELHPNQISIWKKQFLDKAGSVFGSPNPNTSGSDSEKEKERLYGKIGQLQVEVDFLKKKLK
jgi:transposase